MDNKIMDGYMRVMPQMTVKDVNMKYPVCKEVFKKYGIGGCGGPYGPPEPIDFFAKAHNVDIATLIDDLEKAINIQAPQATAAAPVVDIDEERTNILYKLFVKAAIICALTGGALWGVINLTWIALAGSYKAPNYSTTQAHGHVQMFGWVGLFIMGVAYYVIPKFKISKLRDTGIALTSFVLMCAGILIRAFAQPLSFIEAFAYLNVLSAALELIAILCFAFLIIRTVLQGRRGRGKKEFFDKYVYTSVAYFIVLGVFNFFLTCAMSLNRTPIIPQPYNSIFIHIEVYGFITMMILGVSLRVIPHFMGLREPSEKFAGWAFNLLNLGIFLNIAGLFAAQPVSYNILAAAYILEFLAVVLFVLGVKIFAPVREEINIEGVDNAYTWFIRLSYFWLLFAAAMIGLGSIYQAASGIELPHFFMGAYRHAITVGFITTIMLGVAYRVLPVFNGTTLYSNKLMRISFFLIAIGNLLRVGFQLATETFGKPAFALMGTSGYFELTALGLFSYNMWKTLNYKEVGEVSPVRVETEELITPKIKVFEILTEYPQLKQTLIELGFKKLEDPKMVSIIPKFVTLSQACGMEGIDIDKAVKALNEKLGG